MGGARPRHFPVALDREHSAGQMTKTIQFNIKDSIIGHSDEYSYVKSIKEHSPSSYFEVIEDDVRHSHEVVRAGEERVHAT